MSYACAVCGSNMKVIDRVDEKTNYLFDKEGQLVAKPDCKPNGYTEVECSNDPSHEVPDELNEKLTTLLEDL